MKKLVLLVAALSWCSNVLAVPKTYVLTGTVTAYTRNSFYFYPNKTCHGVDRDSDLLGDIPLIIKNGKGEIIKIGSTGTGKTQPRTDPNSPPMACVFSFSIEVPQSEFYSISIPNRGTVNFSFERLAQENWDIELILNR